MINIPPEIWKNCGTKDLKPKFTKFGMAYIVNVAEVNWEIIGAYTINTWPCQPGLYVVNPTIMTDKELDKEADAVIPLYYGVILLDNAYSPASYYNEMAIGITDELPRYLAFNYEFYQAFGFGELPIHMIDREKFSIADLQAIKEGVLKL